MPLYDYVGFSVLHMHVLVYLTSYHNIESKHTSRLTMTLFHIAVLGRGVFVLSVDNDPAKSDGTIQPGDEIIQVWSWNNN